MFDILIILVVQLLFGGIQASKEKHGGATKWFLIETEDAQDSQGYGKGHLKTFAAKTAKLLPGLVVTILPERLV